MTGIFDVLKTAGDNQTSAIQSVQVSSHDNGKVHCYGADACTERSRSDNGPYAQEPDAGKLACLVL